MAPTHLCNFTSLIQDMAILNYLPFLVLWVWFHLATGQLLPIFQALNSILLPLCNYNKINQIDSVSPSLKLYNFMCILLLLHLSLQTVYMCACSLHLWFLQTESLSFQHCIPTINIVSGTSRHFINICRINNWNTLSLTTLNNILKPEILKNLSFLSFYLASLYAVKINLNNLSAVKSF